MSESLIIRPSAAENFDLPSSIVTAVGVILGVCGLVHLLIHPEPISIWAFERLFVGISAGTLTYGGYWIATRSPNRTDRWIAAGGTLSGAVITSAFIFVYTLSEELGGIMIVTEIEQLTLFGALSGSFVAFLVVVTIQYQHQSRDHIPSDGGTEATVFTAENARIVLGMLRRGRVGGVFGLVTSVGIGWNLWLAYLRRFESIDGLVPFETQGITLYLDPDDRGISRELLTYGRREVTPTKVIRRETASLRSEKSATIRALDIGANRGYYTFQLSDIISESGTVFAIEPEPNNLAAIRRGIEANRSENVTIEQGAIGAEDGVQELLLADQSNSHTLDTTIPDEKAPRYRTSIEVPVWTIESFLEQQDLEPGDIDIVKLDVEGAESAVMKSMEVLLEADRPELLFVELHPHRVAIEELREIVDTIESNEFEIVSANSSATDDLATYRSLREHLDSDESSHTVELIVRKPRRG